MRMNEMDGDSDVLCACGCGVHLRSKQVKKGIRFRNRTHANRWKGKNLFKGMKYNKEEKKVSPKVGFNGRMYCGNFDKQSVACITCIELAVFKARSCYKERKIDEV